ncbi:MAG TPA: nucleotidyltransferase domain-containing protein [Candidatus Paceibacterota bacterium]
MKPAEFWEALNHDRERVLALIKETFEPIAAEAHILGSVARGNPDPYSDLDIWITFKDEEFVSVMEKRIELFEKVGNILRVIEPHQNAPINGIFSAVIYRTEDRLLSVDFYLCPESSSFITNESKNLFGNDSLMQMGTLGLNPQDAVLTKEYNIDFCSGFLFGAIKKLVRHDENPLEGLRREYRYLKDRYDIPVKEIGIISDTFEGLYQIAENIKEVANDRQKNFIEEVEKFAKLVEQYEKSGN